MKEVKAIAFDMDGTLLIRDENGEDHIGSKTKEVLHTRSRVESRDPLDPRFWQSLSQAAALCKRIADGQVWWLAGGNQRHSSL